MSGRGTGMLRLSSLSELDEVKRCERAGRTHANEKEIQQAGIALLKHHPRVAWVCRQNTGAGYVLDSRKYHALVAAGHLKAKDARFMRFGFPGAGDATGQLIGGHRLEVEFKAERGVVTDEQQAVHEAVNAAGGLHIIARSVSDLMKALA